MIMRISPVFRLGRGDCGASASDALFYGMARQVNFSTDPRKVLQGSSVPFDLA